ncbi:hypothetical protein, partial [Enterobacter intestinihominis]
MCALLKKRRVAATPYPAYGSKEKVGFVGRVSAAPPGRNVQRPPIPPGLLRPIQRRIGAGDDFRAGQSWG